MATEGGHVSDYDPTVTTRLLAEAVRVLRAFGFANAHAIVVGGLVPSLLIPRPEAGIEPHVGTLDLDLCLSVTLLDGDVGSYEKLETALRSAKYRMVDGASWRWVGSGFPLTIEFFCPSGPGRDAGRLFRPGGVVGSKLSALALTAGKLISADCREVEVAVNLSEGGGETRHQITVVGPAGYLASKADALRRRSKNKDAYDVVWLAEAWPGGQVALASEILGSAIADQEDLWDAIDVLREEFATIDSAGAVKYGRFLSPEPRQAYEVALQRSVGAVAALVDALGRRPIPK